MARRPYRLLLEEDREFAKYLNERYKKASVDREPLTSGERKRVHDKNKEILQALSDLAWFARNWPESQLRLVFSTLKTTERMGDGGKKAEEKEYPSELMDFVKALIDLPAKAPDQYTEEERAKRERIQELSRSILTELGVRSSRIAPEATKVLLGRNRERMFQLEALSIGH